MDANRPSDDDGGLFVIPFRWRRLYRIPTGLAIVAASGAFSWWMIAEGKSQWAALGLGGVFALWGALVAWEALLLAIGLIAAIFAWDWYQGLSDTSRIVLGAAVFLSFTLYGQGRAASARHAAFERRISYLEQQVYDLKTRAGWN